MAKTKTVKAQYVRTELSADRMVLVGFNVDDKQDSGYCLRFVNAGSELSFYLTREAFAAIIQLKDIVDICRDTDVIMEWTTTDPAEIDAKELG